MHIINQLTYFTVYLFFHLLPLPYVCVFSSSTVVHEI